MYFSNLPRTKFYLKVVTVQVLGRQVAQAHLRACLYAGINIRGTNGERMASQVNRIQFIRFFQSNN